MSKKQSQKCIQGLFDPDLEACYGSLLAFVQLSKFRDKKGRVNPSKTPRLRLQEEVKKNDRRKKRKRK